MDCRNRSSGAEGSASVGGGCSQVGQRVPPACRGPVKKQKLGKQKAEITQTKAETTRAKAENLKR